MAFDGSGNFNRTYTWTADAAAGTKILASRHDTHDQDLANGLSNTIAKDGQSSPTADIPFNAKKITNLADPVNDQDAVTKKYMLGGAATQGLWTKLGFASADMSLLGRAAGSPAGTLQRIAYNDKADGTGNDVFVVNDDGTVSARASDGTYKQFQPATAEARSRIVNGAFRISEELGDTVVTTNLTYFADQWKTWISGITSSIQRYSAFTTVNPSGNTCIASLNVGTAKGSLAAGDFLTIGTPIEGNKLVGFSWGTAQAKQAVLAFTVFSPVAGTFGVAVSNGATDRTFIGTYTIAAGEINTAQRRTIVIPGDTTGTWPTGTSVGAYLFFTFASGTTQQGVAGWQAGSKFTTSAQTNGAAAVQSLTITDVGLHLDANATGLAPGWTMPDEADELAACQRYYGVLNYVQVPAAASPPAATAYYKATMRIAPAITGGGAGFSVGVSTVSTCIVSQTTNGAQTLALNARM